MPGKALRQELFNDIPACLNQTPVTSNTLTLFQNAVSVFTEFFAPQVQVWFSGEQK